MTMIQKSIKHEFGDPGMQYRHSDYGRRRRSSPRPSSHHRETGSSLFSSFWVIVNFLLAIIAITIAAIVVAGWLRFVAFGKVSNDSFWRRLTYDTVHIAEPGSRLRMKRFAQGVLQNSESSAAIF